MMIERHRRSTGRRTIADNIRFARPEAASSRSRAKARTASALALESATCPASTFDAASRSSTSWRRRRMRGATSATVIYRP
jgi:hypothetical protein